MDLTPKTNKYADINVHNDIGKGYSIGMNYKRNSVKSNDSEDPLKSPVTQVSEKCYLDTFSKHEKKQSEKNPKDSFDKLNMHDSMKFEQTNYNFSEKLSVHTKEFSDNKNSTKTETNDTEPKK